MAQRTLLIMLTECWMPNNTRAHGMGCTARGWLSNTSSRVYCCSDYKPYEHLAHRHKHLRWLVLQEAPVLHHDSCQKWTSFCMHIWSKTWTTIDLLGHDQACCSVKTFLRLFLRLFFACLRRLVQCWCHAMTLCHDKLQKQLRWSRFKSYYEPWCSIDVNSW